MFSLPYGTNCYFTPFIIDFFNAPEWHKYRSEIVIRNVTMKNATKRGSIIFPANHLLVLSGIQWAEVTDVTIMNNRHGALALYDSTVVLNGHNTLSNNSAINGGGIAMYGKSVIFLRAGSTLKIVNNTADELGGGVFVAQRNSAKVENCFIQDAFTAQTINFQGNKAGYTGSDLYGGSVDHCVDVFSTVYDICMVLELISQLGLLTNPSGCR